MEQIDSFILIGGRSSRLGTDKALVKLDGKSLAERAIDTVRKGLPDTRVTLVAGNSTQFAMDAIASGVPFIFDVHENRGPLGGLHAALAYAQTPWIFLLACDYPFVSTGLIQILAGKIDDRFGAVVPEQKDGRLQPLCAFYNVRIARPIVESFLDRPRTTPPMHEVTRELKPRIIPFETYASMDGAEGVFVNVNTLEELEQARQIVESNAVKPPKK